MPGQDWTREEVEATVADYFDMFRRVLMREPYSKSVHNAALRRLLDGRSRGSVEFKHANISAVLLLELDAPYIKGYQPRTNYQALLRDVVVQRFLADTALRDLIAVAIESPVLVPASEPDWRAVMVPIPKRPDASRMRYVAEPQQRSPTRVNYLEREVRNAALGRAGEDFVLELEDRRLRALGAHIHARRIEHVSRTRGDGLGYDILSFEPDGREKFIEVKTTRFGAFTPFFVTRNEVAASSESHEAYAVYRLFDFATRPKLYVLNGSLNESARLQAETYRAEPR
jgi:hypothetical protein